MRFHGPAFALAAVLFAASCGCGSDHNPVGRVTGTASYHGKPIPSGTIIFEVSGARPSNAKIADGRITEVTTYAPDDGVPVGQARIAVFAKETGPTPQSAVVSDPGQRTPHSGPGYMDVGVKSLIPQKYNDPASSGLTWEIKGDNVVTLDLKD